MSKILNDSWACQRSKQKLFGKQSRNFKFKNKDKKALTTLKKKTFVVITEHILKQSEIKQGFCFSPQETDFGIMKDQTRLILLLCVNAVMWK